MSTLKLLTELFDDDNGKYFEVSVRRAALDVWIGLLASMMDLESITGQKLRVPNTGGRFLLNGKDLHPQIGHNDFDHTRDNSVGFFAMVTGEEGASLFVSKYSHLFVDKTEKQKKMLSKCLDMTLLEIPPFSIFFGHGYFHHAGAGERNERRNLRYHIYLIPEGYVLGNEIAFAYPASDATRQNQFHYPTSRSRSAPITRSSPSQKPTAENNENN